MPYDLGMFTIMIIFIACFIICESYRWGDIHKMPHGIISNTFETKIFFLAAFLSQHLNYSVINIWTVFNYISSTNINTLHNSGR
jgi:hypothetical protein